MRYFTCWVKFWCIVTFASAELTVMATNPIMSNVRAVQRQSTGDLEIWYDLANTSQINLTLSVNISTNGGASWFTPAISNLTGAVSPTPIVSGTDQLIIWQGWRELSQQLYGAVMAELIMDTQQFMVFDLSNGASATNYPVSYLDAPPAGGWTDEYKTTKLVMRKIPAGTFSMGSPTNEWGRNEDEVQHEVSLTKDFFIGVFEVTQQQWELVVGNRPSRFYNTSYFATRPVEQVSYYDIRENATNTDDPTISWPANSIVNAFSFMGLMRTKTGVATLDLPTEAQWEYACRAGTTNALSSGKNLTSQANCPNMAEVGRYWYNGGSAYFDYGDTSVATAKIGSYMVNPWGLYDVHGNVHEWCLDWDGAYPDAASDPKGAQSGPGRIVRGGGWDFDSTGGRSADRHNYAANTRGGAVGFRIAGESLTTSMPSEKSVAVVYDLSPSYMAVGFPFTPFGNTNSVQIVNVNSGDGGTSVKLGGVGLLADGNMTGIELTVTGSGVLAFDWQVSSEADYDWLRFYEVGMGATNQISGVGTGWERIFVNVNGAPDAVHVFRWEYLKDPLGDYVGEDCGWVDAISWEPFFPLTVNDGTGSGGYTNGSPVVITANAPGEHYVFYRWTGDTNGVTDVFASSTTLVMPATGVVVTATYTPMLYDLCVINGSGGGSYPYATTVEIGATAFEDKYFYCWTGDVHEVSDVASATTTVQTADHSLSIAAIYSVPLTVNAGSGGGWHVEGSSVSVSANPDPMYMEFAGWSGDASSLVEDASAPVTSLTMPTEPASLTATYSSSVARVTGSYGRTYTASGTSGALSTDSTAGSPSDTPALKIGGSGIVPDNGFTAFETVVSGSGSVTFWWKVSSESNADYLKFFIDGVEIAAISGTKGPWAQISNRVEGAGVAHTLRWEYVKNGAVASSTDAGWVDDIVWIGDIPAPVIAPVICLAIATNNVFAFDFLGERGIPYIIYSNATLEVSGWTPMDNVPQQVGETNGIFRFEVKNLPPVSQHSGFYRIYGN
jgi:formylglycine-generating enzyme required for sulfatase activity